jgi:site-specific recombinase XerD
MGDITLSQALEEYEKIYMASRNFAQRTRVEYLNDLGDSIQFLEQLLIKVAKDIRLPHIERYLADLDHRGMAGSTRKRKVVAIRSFLWYLYQDSYISTNLAKRLIPPFAEAKSPRYLTKSEYERLLEAASHNPRDFALIQLLLQTGIKLSELTRLTVNDVDLPSRTFPETGVTGYLYINGSERQEARVVPLNHKACLALDLYLKDRLLQTNSVLFINRFGKSLGPRGVEKVVSKYIQQIGLTNANVQALRHTFGIHHALEGAAIKTLQEAMGHKDVRSTMIYFSLTREMKKEMESNAL